MGFDLFIAALLLITLIRGAAKGVAWQLAGIGALVLCFLFATPLSLTIAPMIKLAPPLNRWVAMLGIYLVFSFGTFAIARGFREALEKAKFVEFDRHMGALFGLFKGALLALTITFFAVAMSAKAREYILTTYTGYAAAHIMNAIDPVMPRELHAILEPYIHGLDAVDPALERNRHEFHRELDADPGLQPDENPRPRQGGYRPVTGNTDDGPVRDPFQDDVRETDSTVTDTFDKPPAEAPSLMEEAEQFLQSIPAMASKVGPSLKLQVLKALENTQSEHRDEFADQLAKAETPAEISNIVRAWKNGRPSRKTPAAPVPNNNGPLDLFGDFLGKKPSPPRNPAPPPKAEEQDLGPAEDLKPRRQELLQGIARIFSSQAAQQAKKMTEVETSLLGLPDSVAVGVLEDWLTDLRGEDPDPDPQSDVSTPLNARIASQVDRLGIPRNRLPQEWQTRLERYLR